MGRHAVAPRHALDLLTDDFHRRTLADLDGPRGGRHTAEQPAVRVPERTPVLSPGGVMPGYMRDGAPDPFDGARPLNPMPVRPRETGVPLGLALTAARTSPTWDRPPEWDAILTEIHPGEVHAEPPTWGGRGVRL